MGGLLANVGPEVLGALQVLLAAIASGHVILCKRDVHAAIGWVAVIWLVPFGGAALYLLFGINRVRRRATVLRAQRRPAQRSPQRPEAAPRPELPAKAAHLQAIARLLDAVVDLPLTTGNAVAPLVGGSAAYGEMLAAIASARRSVGLSSYIFDDDAAGRRFVDALARTSARGVEVRVLVDGVGVHYRHPSSIVRLTQAGIRAAEYLPGLFPLFLRYANLRNHRKILVVDGQIAFTGGMNVRAGHLDAAPVESAIRDLHFRLEGPIVGHLATTFVDDWCYATGEVLEAARWVDGTGAGPAAGPVLARGIASGPDEDFERIRWAILAAITQARRCIRIVTPYFLPDATLIAQLQLAARRGVAVEIVIPRRNNLKLVEWASLAKIGSLLAHGCRVWRTPPPFDHAKIMTVDGGFAFIGSANWDPRSFRLNFEFNVECYDEALTTALDGLIDGRIAEARELDAATLAARPLVLRLRDGMAWLLSPYL
jgi:cardiolipin synthase